MRVLSEKALGSFFNHNYIFILYHLIGQTSASIRDDQEVVLEEMIEEDVIRN